MKTRYLFSFAVSLGALASSAGAHAAEVPLRGPHVHVVSTAALGESLRFNNPYRLQRPLGSTTESVSLAAPYADLGVLVTHGRPSGFEHGGSVRLAFALSGISQSVVTPSYVLLRRLSPRLEVWGRAGLPYVTGPSPNVGGELSLGGAWLFTGGVGVTAEVGATGFYGAATREVSATFIPLAFAQLGVAIDWEVLP